MSRKKPKITHKIGTSPELKPNETSSASSTTLSLTTATITTGSMASSVTSYKDADVDSETTNVKTSTTLTSQTRSAVSGESINETLNVNNRPTASLVSTNLTNQPRSASSGTSYKDADVDSETANVKTSTTLTSQTRSAVSGESRNENLSLVSTNLTNHPRSASSGTSYKDADEDSETANVKTSITFTNQPRSAVSGESIDENLDVNNRPTSSLVSTILKNQPRSAGSGKTRNEHRYVDDRNKSSEVSTSDSALSSDISEEFHKSTIYEKQCEDLGRDLTMSNDTSQKPKQQRPQVDRSSKRSATLPIRYSIDYDVMDRRYSPCTLAEIYDDEFFRYVDSRGEYPQGSNQKEGIFCCLVTALAIAALILLSFLIIKLVDPLVETVTAIKYSYSNISIERRQKRYSNSNVFRN